jgi:tRNA(Ile)-lysidine synthase
VLTSRSGIDLSDHFSDFDLTSRKAVIAAVSGGSDSTALLLLLKDHLDRIAPGTRLVAATVDHGLRPGSAAEAEKVGRLCAWLGIGHRSLVWRGPKPVTGLPAAAREARHDLLAEAARREETDLVLIAHTADDQAETVLMRQARNHGRGLAGVAPATLFCQAIWFARPLLAVRRQALRGFLEARGIEWADDPANEDDTYERARIRKALRRAGGEAKIAAALLRNAQAAAERQANGEAAAQLIRDHATQVAPGLTRLDLDFVQAGDAAVYAMRILLAVAGGAPQLPDAHRVSGLVARLAAGGVFRAVLSRCLVDARAAGVFLLREGRGLPPALPLAGGMVWDGRFRLGCAAAGLTRMPVGKPPAKQVGMPAPESLVRSALAAEPFVGEATPHDSGTGPDHGRPGGRCTIVRLVAPWARYLPSFDLAPARAAAALVGAPEIPRPPFREREWA